MDIITVALLPLVLAFIMFALGLSMKVADLKYVIVAPKPFIIGFLSQLLLIPIITFIIIILLKPSPELSFGFMLLSFCPGGVTSNILCRLVNGNLPLSIALTSVMSLFSIITVPILTLWAYTHFMGTGGSDISLISLGIKMFLLTALPVALGVYINEKSTTFTDKHGGKFLVTATLLFILLVILAIISNRAVILEQSGSLIVIIMTLLFVLFVVGVGIPRLLGLSWNNAKTIGIEVGIQNSSMALALAGIISTTPSVAVPEFALPAALYSILMYIFATPYILAFRKLDN